jgi:hypothetical protein
VLPGVKLIQPVTQGQYDGLCALYCIINGIRLVLAPHKQLSRTETGKLFACGIRFIDEEASLSRAVRRSVGVRTWPRLAERLRARAQRMTGIQMTLERPLASSSPMPPDEAIAAIERLILARRAPMVFLRGKYRHYTVICGFSSASLRLFDSAGFQRVQRSSCCTTSELPSLHRIHVPSLITLAAFP